MKFSAYRHDKHIITQTVRLRYHIFTASEPDNFLVSQKYFVKISGKQ